MPATLDYNGDRGLRMLDIFERLNKGERISKRDLTVYYGVGEKTIQRDIEDIFAIISPRNMDMSRMPRLNIIVVKIVTTL